MKYAFIEGRKREYPVTTVCRVLGVTFQGYYAWRDRPLSARAKANLHLSARIRRIHAESKEAYGSPRVRDELLDQGVRCGKNRVARLMHAEGLKAKAGVGYLSPLKPVFLLSFVKSCILFASNFDAI